MLYAFWRHETFLSKAIYSVAAALPAFLKSAMKTNNLPRVQVQRRHSSPIVTSWLWLNESLKLNLENRLELELMWYPVAKKGELKLWWQWNCFNCLSLLHSRRDDEGRWSLFAAIWSLASAAVRAAVSYSLCSLLVILALTSKTLLKPCIVMRASQDRGRLAGEGHAKFTDKGQFRNERRRGEETERAEAEKVEKCDLSPPSTWWNIPRHQ